MSWLLKVTLLIGKQIILKAYSGTCNVSSFYLMVEHLRKKHSPPWLTKAWFHSQTNRHQIHHLALGTMRPSATLLFRGTISVQNLFWAQKSLSRLYSFPWPLRKRLFGEKMQSQMLNEILVAKGFGIEWRRWIWRYILSTNFSIIVNRCPREEILASRGFS